MRNLTRIALFLVAVTPVSAGAQMSDMKMPMDAKSAQTRQAYTTNHEFLVRLVSVPSPIPYEKYFTVKLEVYDGGEPPVKMPDAQVSVVAGMRHGMKTGFAHGMQSAPKVAEKNGVVIVSGMYFHMQGPWTLQTTVKNGSKEGVAYLTLPCCGQ